MSETKKNIAAALAAKAEMDAAWVAAAVSDQKSSRSRRWKRAAVAVLAIAAIVAIMAVAR